MIKQRIAAALLLLPLTLGAQEKSGNERRVPIGTPAMVTLDFAGGTMAEFVAAIRGNQPRANIVLATAARDADVPALVLKDAGLEQALEGACTAAEAGGDVRVKEFRGAGEPVYSITLQRPRGPVQQPRKGQVMQRVMSLNNLTADRPLGVEGMKVRTVLSALELALGDEEKAPRIRFHEDSGLLLVRGTVEQINVVHETLGALEHDMKDRENRARIERQTAGQPAGVGGPKKDK